MLCIASWRSCRGPLIMTVAKSWGKISTVHGTKILKTMFLPGCLSVPWHSGSQSNGLSFMPNAQWPFCIFLVRQLWPLCIFCLEQSEHLCSFWTAVPCNYHPCCGVWPNGQQILGSSSGLFSQLGLCMDRSEGSLSARGSLPPGVGCGFLVPPPVLCNSPATALASSPSCAPLMDGLGCLTLLTDP